MMTKSKLYREIDCKMQQLHSDIDHGYWENEYEFLQELLKTIDELKSLIVQGYRGDNND